MTSEVLIFLVFAALVFSGTALYISCRTCFSLRKLVDGLKQQKRSIEKVTDVPTSLELSRAASAGKWRVIAYNPASGGEWTVDVCSTQVGAFARADDEARDDTSLIFAVYNDAGECIRCVPSDSNFADNG